MTVDQATAATLCGLRGQCFPMPAMMVPGLDQCVHYAPTLKRQMPMLTPAAPCEAAPSYATSDAGMLTSNKCRRLNEGPSKQGWASWEDHLILSSVRELGTKWTRIAEILPSRSDDAVRNRYYRLQKKKRKHDMVADMAESKVLQYDKRGDMWTAEEDDLIMQGVSKYALNWISIAASLPGRSVNAVRNRHLRNRSLNTLCKPVPAPREIGTANTAYFFRDPGHFCTIPLQAMAPSICQVPVQMATGFVCTYPRY